MIKQEEVYKIGRIGKVHGVKGEVNLMFTDDIFNRVEADYLILDIDGILVPFFMEEYRFRSDETALVKFCDIDTQEQARELVNSDVFFPHDLAHHDTDDLSWASITGFQLTDNNTGVVVGKISDVDDSTENILFIIENDKKKEILVPASEELITDVDYDNRLIKMNVPEGILAL